MKKHKLLNYLNCNSFDDRNELDDLYYTLDSYILFAKKIWEGEYKRFYIKRRLFGIELITFNK
jgi:hypothetical protein